MSLRRTAAKMVGVLATSGGCRSNPPTTDADGSSGAAANSGGAPAGTGGSFEGGTAGDDATGGVAGSGGTLSDPVPRLYPVPGFESCIHAEVTADCADGWCKLPPSCFVMGSPEGEWHRGRDSENQTAVTLTHAIEVQQKELTRAQWKEITGLEPREIGRAHV